MSFTYSPADRQARHAERARAHFKSLFGEVAAAKRGAQIGALPIVQWRGRTLYTLRCPGVCQSGTRPHAVNVPPALCWSLIDLRMFHCPYHDAEVGS